MYHNCCRVRRDYFVKITNLLASLLGPLMQNKRKTWRARRVSSLVCTSEYRAREAIFALYFCFRAMIFRSRIRVSLRCCSPVFDFPLISQTPVVHFPKQYVTSDAINSIVPHVRARDNKLYLKGLKQQACVDT